MIAGNADADALVERLGELITNMETRIEERAREMAQPLVAASEDAAAARAAMAAREIQSQSELLGDLRRQLSIRDSAYEIARNERDQTKCDLELAGKRLAEERTNAERAYSRMWTRLTGERDGAIAEVARLRALVGETPSELPLDDPWAALDEVITPIVAGELAKQADEGTRRESLAIDRQLADMIDHALVDSGGRLAVEYIPEDPEYAPGEISYFSAAILGPFDEPLAYGRGDTALEAIKDLTLRQPPPDTDEEPL